jgi:hypothetical protein
MKRNRKEEIEILTTEIENVKRNRYMTAAEKKLKIQQLELLIAGNIL